MKAASDRIEQRRQDAANALHLACHVFANSYIRRLSRAVWLIQKPMRVRYGEDMVNTKTREGEFGVAPGNEFRG